MGYVRGGETLESWCKACGRGPVRDDECELCQQCQFAPGGPSRWEPDEWECDGCGTRRMVFLDVEHDLGGGLYCGNCRDAILRGVEVARAQGISIEREPASDYYSTLIHLDAIEAACEGGDE